MVRSLRSRGVHGIEILAVLVVFLILPRSASSQAGVWSAHGPEGGNVYCVVADPSHPATIYAGSNEIQREIISGTFGLR